MPSLQKDNLTRVVFDETKTVLEASKNRIEHIWNNNDRVFVSYSGGKDSITLANVILETGAEGRIDLKKTHWLFVDEEAIYPCVERVVRNFRSRVMGMGMKFYWYCMPFRHFSALNKLKQDESFICWDPRAKGRWVRDMPSFAITGHKDFVIGESYQEFLSKILGDAPSVIGLRANESMQRRMAISQMSGSSGKLYPIHDWTDGDVWKYIRDRNLEIPDAYIYMYKTGTAKGKLRISQFFSVDTIASLVKMVEFYPDLYQKIINREPNAYLAMMYWDTEMFGRSTAKRRQLEDLKGKDYKKAVMDALPSLKEEDPELFKKIMRTKNKSGSFFTEKSWQVIHKAIVAGDPKGRTMRSIYATFKN